MDMLVEAILVAFPDVGRPSPLWEEPFPGLRDPELYKRGESQLSTSKQVSGFIYVSASDFGLL